MGADEPPRTGRAAPWRLPWWGRAPLAAALTGLLGVLASALGRDASPSSIFYVVLPIVASGNVALGDLGRRPLSTPLVLGGGLASLIIVGCLSYVGVAVLAVALGGFVASRLVGAGAYLSLRRQILFALGAMLLPLATIAAYQLVRRVGPAEPIAVGLAAAHLLFWLPASAIEALFAWSAGAAVRLRALRRNGAPGAPSSGLAEDPADHTAEG